MKHTKIFLLVAAFAVALTSCQKEVGFEDRDPVTEPGTSNPGGNTNISIIGDFDFVGMTASTKSTITVTEAGQTLKNVTTSAYVSKNNTGTVKITATDFISSNLAYDIDTTMKLQMYVNGLMVDEREMPFEMSSPPSSVTAPYVRNNNDSITVTGSFIPTSGSPAAPATTPAGMRISWSGDTLVLRTNVSVSTTTDLVGIPGTMVASISGVMKLKRKP